MKKLRMLLTLLMVSVCSWHAAWAQESEKISVSVSLAEPGSLGTEILAALAQQDISDASVTMVHNLTVSGAMNDADWTILKQMSSLENLDLEDAKSDAVPESQFSSSNQAKNLITIKLPSNLKTIGSSAFMNLKKLVSITIPTGVTSIGGNAFSYCTALEDFINGWPVGATTIPNECFRDDNKLKPFTIPEGVKIISNHAFNDCNLFSSAIPSTVTEIGYYAFYNCSMENLDIVIPEGTSIDSHAFKNTKIKSITFPTTFHKAADSYDHAIYDIYHGCSNLTDVYLKSPTVVENSDNLYDEDIAPNVTLHVPDYLVNWYKQDAKWLLYKAVVGFETTTISDWAVKTLLNLDANSRIQGDANMYFTSDASLKINGTTAQKFGNFTTCANKSYWYSDFRENWTSTLILSGCDNVQVTGDHIYRLYTKEKKWYFLCLPFDFKVSDIVTEGGVKFAIRYYDGANRASTNTASGNWKDFSDNDIVSAGTGFIYQTSGADWTLFKAQSDNTRNYVFRTEEISTTLAKNDCENKANKGWNLVGNPWQTYYNIRKLNYTAPISVFNYFSNKYEAYSPSDDDFALLPNEAFFVQCPDEVSAIAFPIDGRQLTPEIVSQNGTRTRAYENRQLFDLQISGSELTDKTRLVVNPEASVNYELKCDAGKLMVEGTLSPQLYSLDSEGNQYAINERPADNGLLRLGMKIATEGQYTLSAVRNGIGQVILTDNETGIETDLQQNSYTFDTKKGTFENRFTLAFTRGIGGEGTTGIQTIEEPTTTTVEVYTLDGRMMGNTTEGLAKGVYVVRKNQKSQKVIIK